MDSYDLKILSVLDRNARAGLGEIAQASRLSKSAVGQRIKQLEEAGVIEGYYSVIDSSRLGYLSFRVYLKFYGTGPKKEEEVLSFLLKEPRVWWLGLAQGNWDLGFVVWVRSLSDFRAFWTAFLSRFKQNVGNHVVAPYLRFRHFALGYFPQFPGAAREVCSVGEGSKVELDRQDRKILREIAGNARIKIVELAQKTGLTPAIVAYRLKQLVEKKVIVGFRAKINAAALGYSLYKVDFRIADLSRLEEMRQFSQSLPSLVYIDETVGGADLELDFHFKSAQELEQVLGKFKSRFHSVIRQIDYFVYSKEVKSAYFPQMAEK